MQKNILVTGGAGFIGSSFVNIAKTANHNIIVLDKLTYSGKIENINWINGFDIESNFYQGDINDSALVSKILKKHQIDWVVHFAAESHVDNSINNPDPFIQSNIVGTYNLLNCSLAYYRQLNDTQKKDFRFLNISTDEVYGELEFDDKKFNENSNYAPNSPYSSSKAAGDHLVRSWHHTYGLPCLITNCSNNYGPRQHKEKLIPTIIAKALANEEIPIYGNGMNIRDWIYVDDHNHAVMLVLDQGKIGDTYLIGVNNERNNNEIVELICNILDKISPSHDKKSYKQLITYVKDRAGHDRRYAIDNSKITKELGFKAKYSFDDAIKKTIEWYLNI